MVATKTPDPCAPILWHQALNRVNDTESRNWLQKARHYSGSIKYHHLGLSSEIYAAHPLRVGAMALLTNNNPDSTAGVIALLHNVYEVTDILPKTISLEFGVAVSNAISVLTVDRGLQWDEKYKIKYYEAIENEGSSVMLVKVLDKLDNLFLIELNPSAEIRQKYLNEIYRWVLPMAEKVSKPIYNYMELLLNHIMNVEKENDPTNC